MGLRSSGVLGVSAGLRSRVHGLKGGRVLGFRIRVHGAWESGLDAGDVVFVHGVSGLGFPTGSSRVLLGVSTLPYLEAFTVGGGGVGYVNPKP